MFARGLLFAVMVGTLAEGQRVQPLGIYLQQRYSRPDALEWERVKSSNDVQSLQSFVSRYPNSRFIKAAERRLISIQPPGEIADGPEKKLIPVSPDVVRVAPADPVAKH